MSLRLLALLVLHACSMFQSPQADAKYTLNGLVLHLMEDGPLDFADIAEKKDEKQSKLKIEVQRRPLADPTQRRDVFLAFGGTVMEASACKCSNKALVLPLKCTKGQVGGPGKSSQCLALLGPLLPRGCMFFGNVAAGRAHIPGGAEQLHSPGGCIEFPHSIRVLSW